jgi:hypothetical protein
MAIPPNFVKVQITAGLQDGEIMVHGLFIKEVAPFDSGNLQLLADGVRDRWVDFLSLPNTGFGAVAARLSSSTVYQKVTAYKIGPLGTAEDIAEAAFLPGTAVGSQSGANPTELAMCVTMLTGAPGRSNRGRLYLGGFGPNTITSTGRVNVTAAQEIANSMARFLRAVRDIATMTGQQDTWEPQVVSRTRTTARKITSVSIGDVWDVQRRRRNKLVETRFAANVG